MTTALKLSWNRASHVTDRKYTSSPDNREAFSVFFFQFRCHLLSFSPLGQHWTYLMACTPELISYWLAHFELISYWLAPLKVISYWPAPLKFEFSGCSRRILLPSKRFLIGSHHNMWLQWFHNRKSEEICRVAMEEDCRSKLLRQLRDFFVSPHSMKLKNEELKTVKEECINRIQSLFRCKQTANFTDIAGLGLSVDNVALLQLPGSERCRAGNLKPIRCK